MLLSCFLCVILLMLFPGEACAWGIGIHIQLGSHILANLQALPPQLQTLLSAHPQDFLYGCISADISLGKKFTHYLQHCHSWRMGRKVLDAAQSAPQKACAYGYLSHLAADTIAHSYFVPYKMVRTFNTILLKHTYWEVRSEAHVPPETWALARTIARRRFNDNDTLLRGVLSDTIFSFATNKRLFNSLLLLNRLQQWQKMLRSLDQSSKWTLNANDQEEYMSLAREAGMSILCHMEASPSWKADPTGERALNAAKMIRKNLNLLWLDGKLSAADGEAILADLRPRFREGITRPDDLLELLSAY